MWRLNHCKNLWKNRKRKTKRNRTKVVSVPNFQQQFRSLPYPSTERGPQQGARPAQPLLPATGELESPSFSHHFWTHSQDWLGITTLPCICHIPYPNNLYHDTPNISKKNWKKSKYGPHGVFWPDLSSRLTSLEGLGLWTIPCPLTDASLGFTVVHRRTGVDPLRNDQPCAPTVASWVCLAAAAAAAALAASSWSRLNSATVNASLLTLPSFFTCKLWC